MSGPPGAVFQMRIQHMPVFVKSAAEAQLAVEICPYVLRVCCGADEHKASRWNHLHGRPARKAVKSGVQLRISSEYCLSELASGQRASYERLLWRQGWRASDSRRSVLAHLPRSRPVRRMFDTKGSQLPPLRRHTETSPNTNRIIV